MRDRKQFVFDSKRKRVRARFYELQKQGKPAPLHSLCSFDEYEQNNKSHDYLVRCYHQKLLELTHQAATIKRNRLYPVIDIWLEYIESTTRINTFKLYLFAINVFKGFIGNKNLDTITKEELYRYPAYLLNKYSITTAVSYIRIVNIFFKYLHETEQIDILHRIKQVKNKERLLDTVTRYQINLLLNSIAERKGIQSTHYKIAILAAETAMRASEIWSLTVNNIDLSNRVINIKNNAEVDFQVKTGKEDTVPISDKLYEYFKDNWQEIEKHKYYIYKQSGDPYTNSSGVSEMIRKEWQAIGVETKQPLHCIRQSVITDIVSIHGPAIAQIIARHSDIRTTIQRYTARNHLDTKTAINSLNRDTIETNTVSDVNGKTDKISTISNHRLN